MGFFSLFDYQSDLKFFDWRDISLGLGEGGHPIVSCYRFPNFPNWGIFPFSFGGRVFLFVDMLDIPWLTAFLEKARVTQTYLFVYTHLLNIKRALDTQFRKGLLRYSTCPFSSDSSVVVACVSGGLDVQFCVYGLASFDECIGLFSVVDVGAFVSVLLLNVASHPSPILVTELLGNISGRLSGVIFLVTSIPVYDVASSCWCLEVPDDTVDNVSAIYIEVLGCLFFFGRRSCCCCICLSLPWPCRGV